MPLSAALSPARELSTKGLSQPVLRPHLRLTRDLDSDSGNWKVSLAALTDFWLFPHFTPTKGTLYCCWVWGSSPFSDFDPISWNLHLKSEAGSGWRMGGEASTAVCPPQGQAGAASCLGHVTGHPLPPMGAAALSDNAGEAAPSLPQQTLLAWTSSPLGPCPCGPGLLSPLQEVVVH